MDERIGVIMCGHGSRDAGACREFAGVVAQVARRLAPWPVEHGYLEFARPVIREGLERLRERGVDRILAVPGMLFAAGHVKNDVPSVLNAYAAETGVRVQMGRDLGVEPKLLRASADRIEAALERCGEDASPEETLLAVIGRGTSDSDANGNVFKVARMLQEGLRFAHVEVGFSGVAHPRTDVVLERAARLGFRRIVVFPYFLFTGVLVDRIYEAIDRVAAAHSGIEYVKAGYLNDHPLVVESFVERVRGILTGDVNMNCVACKYRTQVLGFESAVGVAQESHHHHVEGIGTDGDHHHHHHHHHAHSHDHGRGHHHHGHDQHDHHRHDTSADPAGQRAERV